MDSILDQFKDVEFYKIDTSTPKATKCTYYGDYVTHRPVRGAEFRFKSVLPEDLVIGGDYINEDKTIKINDLTELRDWQDWLLLNPGKVEVKLLDRFDMADLYYTWDEQELLLESDIPYINKVHPTHIRGQLKSNWRRYFSKSLKGIPNVYIYHLTNNVIIGDGDNIYFRGRCKTKIDIINVFNILNIDVESE